MQRISSCYFKSLSKNLFNLNNSLIRFSSTSNQETIRIPKNPLTDKHSASFQPDNGAIYDKKPFKMVCEKGKKYAWCLCGKSKTQPLCDGTHKSIFLKIKIRPVRFEVDETKEYWMCNCKQTGNRPFCDGTHKQEHIQQAVK
ncbi:CDGSH iron-sulfur domain-containing protein 3, mitochondrial [Chrysoperla carnea]|uniref:CDGSH iron-sulfur domain-containing protein 3, mitochondrial n=1 Tax=Chrysoperla carnea TaxID=189513 RepID=UPI001D091BCB|nr:CDGSH iron-sulfur domain-containing protein 3, mitochondrial [Chrysoperla carnea]